MKQDPSLVPTPGDREAALLALALEKTGVDREAFLVTVCGGDFALLERLKRALASDEHTQVETPGQSDPPAAAQLGSGDKTPKISAAHAPSEETVGQTIGPYRLLEKVGEGGCGVVYVAEQSAPVRRRVALKVIKLGMDTKAVVARFDAERQALAMMDHPNIAKVLDAGSTNLGRPFFVMELVRGVRITDYCDANHLSTAERLELFIQVCQAIQHAHQKGIVHRDIKPSNILVTLHDGRPVPKVIDFGIAKATEGRLTEATVYTQLHQVIGTPAYMSPEQAEMSGLDVDTRSDIYSLGVLLYELLTGRTPLDAEELISKGLDHMRRAIREHEPLKPSTRVATLQHQEQTTTAKRRSLEAPKLISLLRGDLDWIVMKCLEKDRTRRYETANGLAMDLKRHLINEPVTARPPSTAYRFRKLVKRNKLVFAAGTAIALTLFIGIAVSTWQAVLARKAQSEAENARIGERDQRLQAQSAQQTAETERHRANAQAQKAIENERLSRRLLYAADINLAQQALKNNNLGRARRLLDRHRAAAGEEDLRGWEWRYLWQLTRSTSLVTLTNRPVRGFSVSFSPKGNLLAVGWYDGKVDLWDVPSRRHVRALTAEVHPYCGRVAFSPVANVLAATAEPKVVSLYDLDTGHESKLWRAPDQGTWEIRDLSFSQDGSRLVIYAGSRGRQIGDLVVVVNVSSNVVEHQHPTTWSDTSHHGAARLSPDGKHLYLARSDAAASQSSIRCIDLTNGKELWETERHRDYGLTTLDVSPDGTLLASGSGFEDPSIRIWDAATGRLLQRLPGHTGWVCKLMFNHDGQRLISAAVDQSIRIWDTSTWSEIQILRGHTDEVHSVAISDSAQIIASAAKDGDLRLWNASGTNASDGYTRLAENNSLAVIPLERSRLLLIEGTKPPKLASINHNISPVTVSEIRSSADVLGWFGTNLCHWDGTNEIVFRELRGSEVVRCASFAVDAGSRPHGLAFNPKRRLVAWGKGSSSGTVYVASLETPERRIELRSDVPSLFPYYFSEDGNYLLGIGNEAVRVWKVETGQVVLSLQQPVSDAAFAGPGPTLVLVCRGDNDHQVLFFDLGRGETTPRRVQGNHAPRGLDVSPDGKLVALATLGGQVHLFDPERGELVATLHASLTATFAVKFSPDGRRLISTSGSTEAVKLWDVETKQELLTLAGSGSFLQGADWSPDEELVLAGSRPWQAWRAPSWAEIEAAESKTRSVAP